MPAEPASFGDLVRQYRLDGRAHPGCPRRAGRDQPARRPGSRTLGRPTPARDGPSSGRSAGAHRRASRPVRSRCRSGPTLAHGPHGRAVGVPPTPPRGSPGRRQRGPSDLGGEKKRVTILMAEVAGLTDSAHGFEPDLADRLQTSIVPLLVERHPRMSRARSTASAATGSWRSSGRRWPARTTPSGPATQRWRCTRRSSASPVSSADGARRAGWPCASAWHPATSSSAAPATTCIRSTRRSGRPSAWPRVSGRSPPPGPPCCRLRPCARPRGTSSARPVGAGRPAATVGSSAVGVEAFELLGCPARPDTLSAGGHRPPAHAVRWPRRRAGGAGPGARAGRSRTRSDRRPGRRARGGQVAPDLGGDPLGLVGRLAGAGERGRGARLPRPPTGRPSTCLKAYCRIEARDDGPTVREKVTGRLLALDRAPRPDLPALLALLDAPVEDAAWDALGPAPAPRPNAGRPQAPAAPAESGGAAAARLRGSPLDRRRDPGAAGLAGGEPAGGPPAAARVVSPRVRPTSGPARRTTASFTSAPCRASAPTSSWRRSSATMPPCTRCGSTVRKTEGNPLFLEESVRSLVDAGSLIGERGAYRQARPIDAIRVPDTVQTVLSARIDRLDPETKRLLQLAAVIGKDVPFALLRAIVEACRRGAAGRALPHPGHRAHVRGAPAPGAGVHLQARAHARGGVRKLAPGPTARAPRPHRRGDGGRRAATMDAGAGPARRADRPARAITRCGASFGSRPSAYLRRAGLRDGARSANRQAVTSFEQALDALSHLPDRRETQATGDRYSARSAQRAAAVGRDRRDVRSLAAGRARSPSRWTTAIGWAGSRRN